MTAPTIETSTCVHCKRRIWQRDIGPTITGEQLVRWVGVDGLHRVTCPVRPNNYCVPVGAA